MQLLMQAADHRQRQCALVGKDFIYLVQIPDHRRQVPRPQVCLFHTVLDCLDWIRRIYRPAFSLVILDQHRKNFEVIGFWRVWFQFLVKKRLDLAQGGLVLLLGPVCTLITYGRLSDFFNLPGNRRLKKYHCFQLCCRKTLQIVDKDRSYFAIHKSNTMFLLLF